MNKHAPIARQLLVACILTCCTAAVYANQACMRNYIDYPAFPIDVYGWDKFIFMDRFYNNDRKLYCWSYSGNLTAQKEDTLFHKDVIFVDLPAGKSIDNRVYRLARDHDTVFAHYLRDFAFELRAPVIPSPNAPLTVVYNAEDTAMWEDIIYARFPFNKGMSFNYGYREIGNFRDNFVKLAVLSFPYAAVAARMYLASPDNDTYIETTALKPGQYQLVKLISNAPGKYEIYIKAVAVDE